MEYRNLLKNILCFGFGILLIYIYGCDQGLDMVPPEQYTAPLPLDLTEGLVGYWPLDGNGDDLSGNGHDAKLATGAKWSDNGWVNGAVEFDGAGGHAVVDTFELTADEKNKITLKHLLTMTAGFEWDQSGAHQSEPDSPNSEAQMENSSDFIEYVLSKEISDEPGARFNYNSGCTILLAGVIKNVSGMHVDQFAEKYLFRPLGIDRHDWWRTANGLPQTHAGLLLCPRDMAKIGQLYLDHGRWKDQQIVSTP